MQSSENHDNLQDVETQKEEDGAEAEATTINMEEETSSSTAAEQHPSEDQPQPPPPQPAQQQQEEGMDAVAALFALPEPPPIENGNNHPTTTPKEEQEEENPGNNDDNNDSSRSNNYNHAQLLLPLTVLDCPAVDGRDRAAWMRQLVRAGRRREPRVCTVWLRTSNNHKTKTSKNNNKDHYKDELMRQCLQQEPGRDWYRFLSNSNNKRNKKSNKRTQQPQQPQHEVRSRTGILTAWAAHTRAFDAIRVYFECDDSDALYGNSNSNSALLPDLLQWCASRRAWHGLPLEVVWMRPHAGFRRPVPLHSATPSAVGLRTRVVSLPAPSIVLRRFQEELLKQDDNDNCLGILFQQQQQQPQIVDTVRRVFAHQNRSAVYVIQQVKQSVAEQLAAPGSFWTVAPWLLPRHARRMTALLLDADFQRSVLGANYNKNKNKGSSSNKTALLEWLASLEVRRRLQASARRVQRILYEKFYDECNSDENDSSSSSSVVVPYLLQRHDKFPIHDQTLTDDDRRILLEPVAAQLRNVSHETTPTVFSQLALFPTDRVVHEQAVRRDLQHALNELVVLVDRCATVVQVQRCLVDILQQHDNININRHGDANESDRLPQPRRDHVTALLEDLEHDENRNSDDLDNDNLKTTTTTTSSDIHIPGLLYRIILDRAAISEDEWFQAFYHERKQQQQHDLGLPDAFNLFGCGVRDLQISGLIRPRRIAGKSETLYEKTALVWCGGD